MVDPTFSMLMFGLSNSHKMTVLPAEISTTTSHQLHFKPQQILVLGAHGKACGPTDRTAGVGLLPASGWKDLLTFRQKRRTSGTLLQNQRELGTIDVKKTVLAYFLQIWLLREGKRLVWNRLQDSSQ